MSLAEYVYTDFLRLDSYFQQISEPTAVVKIPHYKVEIGLFTGPKVTLSQNGTARDFTTIEKINKLLKYLDENEMLGRARADSSTYDAYTFRLEVCVAERIHIPVPTPPKQSDVPLNFWLSETADLPPANTRDYCPPGRLYLLEDYKASDETYPGGPSSWSGLKALLDYERRVESRLAVATLEHGMGGPEIRLLTSDAGRFFEAAGAIRSGPRTVKSLYRVRETFMDYDLVRDGVNPFTTVGYPIFIDALPTIRG